MADIYSVSGVNAYIKDLFDRDDPLRDIWVRGEVSNMKAAASGHWYFSIKDRNSQMRCVMFKNNAIRQNIEPRDGEEIAVHGRISVYEARGEYQLYADTIQLAGGIGDLYQRFEQTKQQLQSEGLFDEHIKQRLPLFPMRIGVVTSPDAAALRDILNVLSRRFPLAEVILSPTLVQGVEAPAQIVRAIERLNQHSAADVMLVTRGGGSIEDLWAFNDEGVARAIANSQLPVVSGVGHETDFTIADFVADVRAPTPSAAAEVCTPNAAEIVHRLRQVDSSLDASMLDRIGRYRNAVTSNQQALERTSPLRHIESLRQRLDELAGRMETAQTRRLSLQRERLAARTKALENANPTNLLQRGYAIVTHAGTNQLITSADDTPTNTPITIRLNDGTLHATVEEQS